MDRENADLSTAYAYRKHVNWRWTHGYVENLAAAIVLAALQPRPGSAIYNVGERETPTVSQRLASLPESSIDPAPTGSYRFDQNIAYDTTRIRRELGYCEPVDYAEGLRRTFAQLR